MVLKELGVKGTDAVFYQSTKRDRVVFVDEVPPGLLCPVCRDVFIAPKIAQCGHPVCEECVRKVVKQTGKCFSCSAFVDHNDYLPDELSEVKLGDLKVLCRHALGLRQALREDEEEIDEDEDEAAAAARMKRRRNRSAVEVFVRFEDFDVTACSLSLPLRNLDEHDERCDYKPLMCDLCDMEETEKDEELYGVGKENGDPKETVSKRGALRGVSNAGTSVCGFNCMARDMPHHRTTCENRLVNCTYANFGCEWRGSFRRLASHGSQCRVRPRLCPNGCGANVSVGPMMKKHLDMCPDG
jgi:TNF receptor-associated factor 4